MEVIEILAKIIKIIKTKNKIILSNKKIDIIFTETYFVQQYENQPLFADIVKYLSNFGYTIQDIYNPIYGMSKLAWCDVLFVREDLKL